ncbi:MAG TPA: hypothetical protein VFB01_16965 [Burkholderiales bacterium]|nr:hypothetical protein [Burkholderiales bacterium]
MSIAKRSVLPPYRRKPALARPRLRASTSIEPVLVRTVAFMPAYQRKRIH